MYGFVLSSLRRVKRDGGLAEEELFPADAFGLFYLRVTRIPGGWHRHAEYEIFYHMHSKIPSEISDSTVRALRILCHETEIRS